MKGYMISEGYMGYVGGVYMLFASEGDYRDYYWALTDRAA